MTDTPTTDPDVWTSVSYISTHTDSNFIYANGLNMIAVDVTIQATNQKNNNMLVKPEVLENAIILIDYYKDTELFTFRDPNGLVNTLGDSWYYTKKTSMYAISNELDASGSDNSRQTIRFYIYTYNSNYIGGGPKTIGVIINPNPNIANKRQIVYSANSSKYTVNPATFEVRQPIYYDTNSISLISVDSNQYTNYYVTARYPNLRFVCSEILGPGHAMQYNQVAYKVYYYGNLRCIYMWNIGPQSTETELGWGPYVTATVNDRPGAFTITRTYQREKVWNQDSESEYECVFVLYDQYGNYGKFKNRYKTGLYGEQTGFGNQNPNRDKDLYDLKIDNA